MTRHALEAYLADHYAGSVAGHDIAARAMPDLALEIEADQTVLEAVMDELGWRKPHPAIYAHALARMECGPRDAVFVGDNPDCDYHGPRAAGLAAYPIDPTGRAEVPAADRLDWLADLPDRLGGR